MTFKEKLESWLMAGPWFNNDKEQNKNYWRGYYTGRNTVKPTVPPVDLNGDYK